MMPAVTNELEITGHIIAHLTVSMSPKDGGPLPKDLDIFVTLRHLNPAGKESESRLDLVTINIGLKYLTQLFPSFLHWYHG
jgi:hypothetical protein